MQQQLIPGIHTQAAKGRARAGGSWWWWWWHCSIYGEGSKREREPAEGRERGRSKDQIKGGRVCARPRQPASPGPYCGAVMASCATVVDASGNRVRRTEPLRIFRGRIDARHACGSALLGQQILPGTLFEKRGISAARWPKGSSRCASIARSGFNVNFEFFADSIDELYASLVFIFMTGVPVPLHRQSAPSILQT